MHITQIVKVTSSILVNLCFCLQVFLCLRQRSGRRHYVFGSSVRPVLFVWISQEPSGSFTSNLVWGYILGGQYFVWILRSQGQRSKVTCYFVLIWYSVWHTMRHECVTWCEGISRGDDTLGGFLRSQGQRSKVTGYFVLIWSSVWHTMRHECVTWCGGRAWQDKYSLVFWGQRSKVTNLLTC